MGKYLPPVFLIAAAGIIPYSVGQIFFETPIEAQMGTAQKIFYFHVPLAWVMMAFAFSCGIAAIVQLVKGSRTAEATAVALAELTVLTGIGVLITGPIWAHATWGRAWTWDARQVTTGLLWLIFVAYVLVRRYGAVGSERLAAALAIFGAVDTPIIYYAVKVWKTDHPSNNVVGTLPQSMWNTLWVALLGLVLLSLGVLFIRIRQGLTDNDLDDAWIGFDERAQAQQGDA